VTPPLAIADCRVKIGGLGIEGLEIGLRIGDWIVEDGRVAIGVSNPSVINPSVINPSVINPSVINPIANPIATRQSTLINRQSAIQSPLDTRQSVNRPSAIGNRQ